MGAEIDWSDDREAGANVERAVCDVTDQGAVQACVADAAKMMTGQILTVDGVRAFIER